MARVEDAEKFLAGLGVKQLRVRVHGDIARIEVPKEDMPILLNEDTSRKIVDRFKVSRLYLHHPGYSRL